MWAGGRGTSCLIYYKLEKKKEKKTVMVSVFGARTIMQVMKMTSKPNQLQSGIRLSIIGAAEDSDW